MKALHFFLISCVAFCSCLNQKYLAKNQVVYKVVPLTSTKSEIKAYSTGSKKVPVVMQDTSGVLSIKEKDSAGNGFTMPTIVESSFTTTPKYQQLSLNGAYYFPETQFPVSGDINSNSLFIGPKKLKYSENNLVVQLVTTPLKIRPAIAKKRFKDSLGTQALAELNIGAAFGFKKTWGTYKAHANENGQNISSTSLSCSGFLSIGGTNVKPITTRYFTQVDKTQPAISYGILFLFGFNNVNIGGSIGTDHLLVPSIGTKWIFDGAVWYGITVAYDIFK